MSHVMSLCRRCSFRAVVVLLAAVALPLAAETASDPSWGFSFTVPAGWKVHQEPAGALLGHNTIAGLIMVLPHSAASLAEVGEEMLQGLVEESMELMVTGKLEQVAANTLGGACEEYVDGQQAKGTVLGVVSPLGGGAYVITVSTPQAYRKDLAAAADKITKGMQFPKVDASELVRALAGTRVTMTSNTETRVTLAPNGQFSLYSESSYEGGFSDSGGDVGGWGTDGRREYRGRWTMRGTRQKGVITLVYERGERADVAFSVPVENGETYWNEYWLDGELYGRQR
jgi:hypothetical protein